MSSPNEKFLAKILFLLKQQKKLRAFQEVIKKFGFEVEEAREFLKSLEEGKEISLIIDKEKTRKRKISRALNMVNSQKELREDFIKHLSPVVAKKFKGTESIFFPQSAKILVQFRKKLNYNFPDNKEIHTAKKIYKTVSWPREVIIEQKHLGTSFDDIEGYYYPFYAGSSPPFNQQYLNPLYKIKFKILRQNFEELWTLCGQQFGFFSFDFTKGYHIRQCIGYLPDSDYNPDEIFFEIFIWGL